MKLTYNEGVALEALQAAGGPLPIEEIADAVYGAKRPPHWRKSLISTMRMLIAKSQTGRDPVVKVSGVGRGSKAIYAIDR